MPIYQFIAAIIFGLVVMLITFIILLYIDQFLKKIGRKRMLYIILLSPFVVYVSIKSIDKIDRFLKSPMTVKKKHLEGDYVINRNLFKGPNADWQYEHYRLSIKDNELVLTILNNGHIIKKYRKPIYGITKGKHDFIMFYNDWRLYRSSEKAADKYDLDTMALDSLMKSDSLGSFTEDQIKAEKRKIKNAICDRIYTAKKDSIHGLTKHHMLKLNPLLHADPHSFNIVLRSTKYGNMFFIKE
ncbi:MAG: hypothetical protein AAF617_14815 [Bacteroidota bacterium]